MVYAFVLSGDTYIYREKIKEIGFDWRKGPGVWVKPLAVNDASANEQVKRAVRNMVGVTLTIENAFKFGMASF